MSKKSKYKKQPTINTQQPSKATFTFEAVQMLKDALLLVETSLIHNTQPLPNIELAAETLQTLKVKLDDMLQYEQWNVETPLDYNELHILYGAIHMYLVHLNINKREVTHITSCLLLCKQFRGLVEGWEVN